MKERQVRDNLKLHLLVIIWGFTAILGRLITLPPVEVVFFRTLIAAAGLAGLLVMTNVWFRARFGDILRFLGIGALISAHWILFFASARVSTISICLVGMATTALWTSLLEPILNKRPVQLHEVALGLVVVIGLYVVFQVESGHALGLVLAIISAFLAALFSVFNGMLTKRYDHHLITFYEMVGASLSTVLFIPFYQKYMTGGVLQLQPTPYDWLYLAVLAIICTVYAYSQWVELMKRTTAYAINLVVNLEPIYGIILALLIFGESEKMNTGFYFGSLIILLAVFGYPIINKRVRNRKTKRIY